MPSNPGGIVTIAFPSHRLSTLRSVSDTSRDDYPAIYAISEPSRAGHIVYVKEIADQYYVNRIDLNGHNERTVFSRHGAPLLGDGSLGESISLSNTHDNLALLTDMRDVQMQNPPTLLSAGSLKICDIDSSQIRRAGIVVLDEGVSWFPDGRRLACVQLFPRKQVLHPESFGTNFGGWTSLPVVCILDTSNGKETVLGVGWHPVVSTNGENVIIHDGHFRPRIVSATTGRSSVINVPGLFMYVIGMEGDLVIYWALPTAGTPRKFTKFNSPLSSSKQMPSIKVARLNSDKFETILQGADVRDMNCIRFGYTSTDGHIGSGSGDLAAAKSH
jgi:hypothetical protein